LSGSGPDAIKTGIAEEAGKLGFAAVGFAAPTLPPAVPADLDAFLGAGLHGEMDWLARRAHLRRDPAALWEGVRSIVVLGLPYAPEGDPRAGQAMRDRGAISVYARGRDYHDVLKGRLKRLASWIAARHRTEVKVFVDTAPVMEKPLAELAGIGWQGKHTNLVSRVHGSWLFLGEIFTALELPPDAPESDHCGTCRACLDACPTGAFLGEGRIDARRCISYLTIEHKGPIPAGLRPLMGNRVYGCDDCLAVCPWNKFADAPAEEAFRSRTLADLAPLAELAALDDAAFRAAFAGTAIKRTGRDRFVRNVLIAVGNSGDPALATVAEARLDDPSALVRGMAVWALARLAPDRLRVCAADRRPGETDFHVKAEWAAALA
jgi:epoxyqueuosine reductase